MARPAIEVNVGGQLYRLVASAGEQSIVRYAGIVNDRLRELTGSDRSAPPQALLLVAMALAHDLEQERTRHAELRERAETALRSLIDRVDAALDGVDEDGEPLPSLPVG